MKGTETNATKQKKKMNEIREEEKILPKQVVARLEKIFSEELNKVRNENEEMLKKERSELHDLESINKVLITKERGSNDELQEARRELIRGFRGLSDDESDIKIKMMGEIDGLPFLEVCKQRFRGEEVELEHALICSKWQKAVQDSGWYPFKRQGTGDQMKEIVDEEREELKKLREEWGEEALNAVKTALEELNEYNPSGRYPVQVLWNFEQGRKASVKEGIAHMSEEINSLKRKRS